MDETLACSLRPTKNGGFFTLGPRSVHYLPAVAEYVLLRLVVMRRAILGSDAGPLEAHFAHHRPRYLAAHRAAFRMTLRFDCSEVGLLFEQSVLTTPVPSAELRIELAVRRLQEGRVAIGDIAFELGFQDQSAFTKFFKRRAGVLPLEYRRRYGFGAKATDS